jgi:hypothetical protein
MKCPKCGTESEAKFCKNCGSPMSEADMSYQNAPQQNVAAAPVKAKKKPIYKKWWFWVIVAVVAIVVIGNLGENNNSSSKENGSQSNSQAAQSSKPTTSSQPAQQTSYQSILDTYSAKIKAATPKLVEEYKKEAANNTSGLEGLAKISNDKISELAELSNEGIGEMAKIWFKSGSGKYSEYEDWAGKLMAVYMSEAGIITDAYINSATP